MKLATNIRHVSDPFRKP